MRAPATNVRCCTETARGGTELHSNGGEGRDANIAGRLSQLAAADPKTVPVVTSMQSKPRGSLSSLQRRRIKRKTAGRCHVCGGPLGAKWQADHVRPYARGGDGAASNYLPCCKVCNRARWHYRSKKIRNILKYGVFAYSQVINRSSLGKELKKQYRAHREKTKARRVPSEGG